ncbi:MAG: zf-HC2 domain-containing protein [Holophagaceae bacterium]
MNGCRPFRELVSEALDAPLGREDQARLDAHLEGCEACRAYTKDLAAVRDAVKGVEEVEPPVGFATRVMAHVRAEAAPKPGLWQRLRPLLLKPQFQVATLLLVGVTSALLIRSRSGMGDGDVIREMRQKAAPAPEAAPGAPRPAEAPAEAPAEEPRRREAEKPASSGGGPVEADKLKRFRDADTFAPPPPAQALGAARGAPAPASPASAAAPMATPAPAPAPPPSPEAAAESKAFGFTSPPKAAKPAAGGGPGAANTAAAPAPARADREEAARDTRQPRLDDAGARAKKGESSLAKEQVAKQEAEKDQERQSEDAVPAVFLVWEPEDPDGAAALATREIERLGGSVDRGGRRQQQVPRSLTGRLPAHQLPQFQARLARHGAVRPGAGQQQQAPKSGSVVFLLRW